MIIRRRRIEMTLIQSWTSVDLQMVRLLKKSRQEKISTVDSSVSITLLTTEKELLWRAQNRLTFWRKLLRKKVYLSQWMDKIQQMEADLLFSCIQWKLIHLRRTSLKLQMICQDIIIIQAKTSILKHNKILIMTRWSFLRVKMPRYL